MFRHDQFEKMPVVGILRNYSAEVIYRIVPLYRDAGFTTLELTLNTPGACRMIADLKVAFPELNIGAGTVLDVTDLENALIAGASFVVTPMLDEQVLITCRSKGIPVFPGAYTPLEIYRAWSLGATAVKVFPATQLGPGYIAELSGPFEKIQLLPTGGVNLLNVHDFFAVGAYGVGMGKSLFPEDLIYGNDDNALSRYFKKAYALISEVLEG